MKIKELDNGARIVALPVPSPKTAYLSAVFKVGSRHDPRAIPGLAHLLEHMSYKGAGELNAATMLSHLDSLGGVSNAFTDMDMTCYEITTTERDLPQAAKLLFDLVARSWILPKDLEKEKGVILDEISDSAANAEIRNLEALWKLAYPNSGLDHYITGDEQSIRYVTSPELKSFRDEFYCGSNLTVVLVGTFPPSIVADCLAPLFSQLPAGKPSSFTPVVTNQDIKPAISSETTDGGQIRFSLGFPLPPLDTKELLHLHLLNTLLCNSWSSRLMVEIRENHGWAYDIDCDIQSLEDCGLIIFGSSVDYRHGPLALEAMLKILKSAKETIYDEEIIFFSKLLGKSLQIHSQDLENCANYCQYQLLRGKQILSMRQKLSVLDKATVNDIIELANRLLDFNRMNLAIYGPEADDKRYFRLIDTFN